jgi:hypothetical protein
VRFRNTRGIEHRFARGLGTAIVLVVGFGVASCHAWVRAERVSGPLANGPSVLAEVLSVVEKGEAAELTGELAPWMFSGGLEDLTLRLATYLDHHPRDAQAWMLRVRLARLARRLETYQLTSDSNDADLAAIRAKSTVGYTEILEMLDRARAAGVEEAEVHYWRARILAFRGPVLREGRRTQEPWNLPAALAEAREAVNLAPANDTYRVALASLLILDGRDGAALEVFEETGGDRDHWLAQLLRDLCALSGPPGAIPVFELAEAFAEIAGFEETPAAAAGRRVRAYVVAAPPNEVEDHYHRRIPNLKFSESLSEHAGGRVVTKRAWLLLTPEGLQPASEDEVQNTWSENSGRYALLLLVNHQGALPRNPIVEFAAEKLPEANRELFSQIVIATFRNIEPGPKS